MRARRQADEDDARVDAVDAAVCSVEWARVGAPSDYPLGSWTLVSSGPDPIVIAHDRGGLYAYSAICTHADCTVSVSSADGTTVCGCHQARFDGNGAVISGPARLPLPHFALAICGGVVSVSSATVVAAETRTPVT